MDEVIRGSQFVESALKTIQVYQLSKSDQNQLSVQNETVIKLVQPKSDRLKQLFKELGKCLDKINHFLIVGTYKEEKIDIAEIFRKYTKNVQNTPELSAAFFFDTQV